MQEIQNELLLAGLTSTRPDKTPIDFFVDMCIVFLIINVDKSGPLCWMISKQIMNIGREAEVRSAQSIQCKILVV